MKGFSKLAAPLTNLTKKRVFRWNEQDQQSFKNLKKTMSSCLILAIPNFFLPFELQYDVSREGIGAVLIQNKHPIAFESRKLHPTERSFSVCDKEMLAIMHAFAKFRQYFVCGKFVVEMDCNSLQLFLRQQDLIDRQQKRVSKLQGYNFDIEYIKGKNNVVDDGLCRMPYLCALINITTDWKHSIIADYAKDSHANNIMDGNTQSEDYKVVEGIILYKNRIYLTPGLKMKATIIKEFHDSPLVGYQGYSKTYKQVREKYSWKGLEKDILRDVHDCMTCQRNKKTNTSYCPASTTSYTR